MKRIVSLFLIYFLANIVAFAQNYVEGDLNKDGVIDVRDLNILVDLIMRSNHKEEDVPADEDDVVTDSITEEDTTISVKLEEFQIMNDAVVEFINNTTTDFTGIIKDSVYGKNFFDKWFVSDTLADRPCTKIINFNSESEYAVVQMSNQKDYSLPVLMERVKLSDGHGSYRLRNFIPGLTYYYKVETEDGALLLEDSLKTIGQVRMIQMNDAFNIRDIGGYEGLNGKRIKYGQLYRGATLGGRSLQGIETRALCSSDKREFERLGVKAVLDLRGNPGLGKVFDSYVHSYSLNHSPLSFADFNNIMSDYGEYHEDASLVSDMAWIIHELKNGKPVYFHCRQGADRTGALAFLIEGLLGCYENGNGEYGLGHQMAIDYELTSFSRPEPFDPNQKTMVYKSAYNVYNAGIKMFDDVINLEDSITRTLQEKCYYYLNSYWKNRDNINPYKPEHNITIDSNIGIDKADLDWFIKYMLDLSDDEYETPSFAVEGDDLYTIATKNSNTVINN